MTATSFDLLVVGGGHAGTQIVSDLRAQGYDGSIGLLGAEVQEPYERPPLSKDLELEAEPRPVLLRPSEFWAANRVELLLGRCAASVDTAGSSLVLDDGARIGYHRLVWAAGGRARPFPGPGADLRGVLYLRTLADAAALRAAGVRGEPVVIIGGGYVGLEAAAILRRWGLDVTVVEAAPRILARVTSEPVSDYVHNLHTQHGVRILPGTGVRRILGQDRVSGVELSDGRQLPAGAVLVGIGMLPNVEPLVAAGADAPNGVLVDPFGRTTIPAVYAAGDCACSVKPYTNGRITRLESVNNAVEQARTVVAGLLGMPRPTAGVPWFWSNQYSMKLKTVGLVANYDDFVIRGDQESGRFSVVYTRGGSIIAVDAVNAIRDYAQARTLIEAGVVVDGELADPDVPLKSFLTPASAQVAT